MKNQTKLVRLSEPLADWVRLQAEHNSRSITAELGLIVQAEQLRRQMNHADLQSTQQCAAGQCCCAQITPDAPEGGVAESPACP